MPWAALGNFGTTDPYLIMPYYVAVAAVYGTLAHLTNSISPSMVLSVAGTLVTGAAAVWAFSVLAQGARETSAGTRAR